MAYAAFQELRRGLEDADFALKGGDQIDAVKCCQSFPVLAGMFDRSWLGLWKWWGPLLWWRGLGVVGPSAGRGCG